MAINGQETFLDTSPSQKERPLVTWDLLLGIDDEVLKLTKAEQGTLDRSPQQTHPDRWSSIEAGDIDDWRNKTVKFGITFIEKTLDGHVIPPDELRFHQLCVQADLANCLYEWATVLPDTPLETSIGNVDEILPTHQEVDRWVETNTARYSAYLLKRLGVIDQHYDCNYPEGSKSFFKPTLQQISDILNVDAEYLKGVYDCEFVDPSNLYITPWKEGESYKEMLLRERSKVLMRLKTVLGIADVKTVFRNSCTSQTDDNNKDSMMRFTPILSNTIQSHLNDEHDIFSLLSGDRSPDITSRRIEAEESLRRVCHIEQVNGTAALKKRGLLAINHTLKSRREGTATTSPGQQYLFDPVLGKIVEIPHYDII